VKFWGLGFRDAEYYPWGTDYIAEYQVPNQFVSLATSYYRGYNSFSLHFFRINPHNSSKQLTNKQNQLQINKN
jgi:hypothetical protein